MLIICILDSCSHIPLLCSPSTACCCLTSSYLTVHHVVLRVCSWLRTGLYSSKIRARCTAGQNRMSLRWGRLNYRTCSVSTRATSLQIWQATDHRPTLHRNHSRDIIVWRFQCSGSDSHTPTVRVAQAYGNARRFSFFRASVQGPVEDERHLSTPPRFLSMEQSQYT